MKEYVIFDIDGTLSDSSHRIQHAHMKDWDTFQSLAIDDPVIVPIATLLRRLSRHADVILLTGRQEKYRHITKKWLEDAELAYCYEELIMREDDDFSHDINMKIKALEKRFGNQENVIANVWFVIDDRDSVVEGFRNYGLTVLQPVAGSY